MNQIKEKKSEAIYKIWHFFQWTKRQINKIDNSLFKCLSICFTDLFDKSRAFIIYQQINGKSRLENNGMLEVLCNKTRSQRTIHDPFHTIAKDLRK